LSSLSVAAPVLLAAQTQAAAAQAPCVPADKGYQPSFAQFLKEHDTETDENAQGYIKPAPPASPKAAQPGKDEPRRKTSDEALLSLCAPVPQQQVVDSRGLLLAFPTKEDPAVNAKAAAPAASNPQSNTPEMPDATDTPSTAPVQPQAPVAFGVTIAHPQDPSPPPAQTEPQAVVQDSAPAPAPKAAPVTAQSHSVLRTKTAELPSTAPGPTTSTSKPELQPEPNGNSQQQPQHSSKEKDSKGSTSDSSHKTTATARESDTAAPTSQPGSAPKVDTAAPVATTHVQSPNTYVHGVSVNKSDPSAVVSPAHTAAVSEPPATPVVRPHAIDLKVGEPGNGQVDVRIAQRAGDVEVTVRTPDTDLAQSLRQHLPELSDRLGQAGIHGDVWQPASAQASAGDTNGQPDSGAGQWQREQHGGQHQRQQQEQANSQQQDSDKRQSYWLNAFFNADKEA
jgi:hypothetical protein